MQARRTHATGARAGTAERITVVLDNLNTHSPASLYAAFPPDEAHRILSRLDFHSTPKQASWLNMVEIELAVLVRHCLNRRIPDLDTLAHEVAAWERDRNAHHAAIRWLFDLTQARTKLSRLYPQLSSSRPTSINNLFRLNINIKIVYLF